MASFKYDFFQGIRPRLSPRLLVHPQAQTMDNARMGTGAIEPWRGTLLEQDLTSDSNGIETIYRFRQGGLLRNRVWFEFSDDVDLARGPLLDDALERTYYTGTSQATPRMTYTTLVTTSGQQPNAFRILGIAAPAAKPTLVGAAVPAIIVEGTIPCTIETPNAGGNRGGLTGIQTTTLKADFCLEELGRLPYVMNSWFFGDDDGYRATSELHTFEFDVAIGNELKIVTVPSSTTFTANDANGGSSIWKTVQQEADNRAGGLNKFRDNDTGTAHDGYFRFEVQNGTLFSTSAAHGLKVDDVIRISGITDPIKFTLANGLWKSNSGSEGGEFFGGELGAVGIDADVDTWPDGHGTHAVDGFFISGAGHKAITVYWGLAGPSDSVLWPFEGTLEWTLAERGGIPYSEVVTDVESRIYVYTWVTDLGEEGPPSDPSDILTIPTDGSVTVTLPSTAPSTNQTITKIRIYRANTGSASSEFQFVAEETVTGGGQNYVDTILDINLGEVLQTASWIAPDANMVGITSLPNGVLAGFTGKDVQFSEPYFPHAWPTEYEIAVDHDIIGLGVLPQGTLVLTTGTPYMIVGNHPRAFSLRHFEFAQSCSSKKSIVNTKDSIIYASPDGLVMIGAGSGLNIITENYFTKKEWNELLDPTTIKGEWHDGRYFGFHSGGGFVFDPFDESIGFTTLDETAFATYVDPETDDLYIITCPPNSTNFLVGVGNSSAASNNLMSSPDGTTWTQRSVTTRRFLAVAYSPELCLYATIDLSGANPNAYSSTDGITWSGTQIDGSNFAGQDLIWSTYFKLFIAVGTGTTHGNIDAAWSADGITWQTSPIQMFNTGIVLAEAPLLRKVIAIDDNSTPNIFVTYNGKTWIDTGSNFPISGGPEVRGLAWSESLELFVAVTSQGELYWSADGLTWTLGATQAQVDQDVAWSPEEAMFVAVGDGGTSSIATSTDGKTWTARTNPESNLALHGVVYHVALDLWVAVGLNSSTTNDVITSPDGITWTARNNNIDRIWQDVAGPASVTQAENWAIRKWDGDQLAANNKTITWKSGQLRADYPFNLAVGRVIADTYPVAMEVFNEGVSKKTISILNDEMFRMPGGFLGDYVELEIKHTGTIRSVMVAETVKELLDG